MFNSLSLFIAARYSRAKQANSFIAFITFFSVAGITLGVLALITVVSVMNGFESELKKRVLGVIPHIVVNTENPQAKHWQDVSDNLAALEQVDGITAFSQSEGMVQSPTDMKAVMVQGVSPELAAEHSVIAKHMSYGKFESLQAKEFNVVIGRYLASRLDIGLGDQVRIMLAAKTRYTPMGRMPMQRKFTVTGIFDAGSDVDGNVALIHHSDLARLLRKSPKNIDSLRIYLHDAFEYQAVVEHIKANFPQWQVTDWRQSQGKLFSAVKMEKNMMWLMLCLIVAVAAFNIVSALVMVVTEKQGEIAMLKTLGLPAKQIQMVFLLQGLYKGCLGAVLGTALGVTVAYFLNDILTLFGGGLANAPGYELTGLPVDIRFDQVVIISLSAIGMSLLATIYPSYRAAHTKPADILRYE